MHAIHEHVRSVEGTKFSTFSRDVIRGSAELGPEAGTTGLRGYTNREKSSRGFISLDLVDGDYGIRPLTDGNDQLTGFEIACCGDHELHALAEALYFMYQALLEGMHGAR